MESDQLRLESNLPPYYAVVAQLDRDLFEAEQRDIENLTKTRQMLKAVRHNQQ